MHIKQMVITIICIGSFHFLFAQSTYLTHTLKQGESLSMLAQQYKTSVGDIMRLNGMHADTKLVYGSKIKIPATKTQFESVKKTANTIASTASTSSSEITHVVMKGETLYSISKKYNVSVDQLKSWNHLSGNNANIGTLLIISDKGNDKLAGAQTQKQRVETVTATQQTTQPITGNNQIKQTDETANNNAAIQQDIKDQTAIQTETVINTQTTGQTSINYSGRGFFAADFKERKRKEMQNISGISKTFKTTSGWSDGKYYILANDIEPGTIVKVTADNGNTVFAKVLWNMGDLKDNAGINFRISNATAAALHEETSSFNLSVSF
ncbi:MAG: LysM peptidoglycan-binding domain-containing protein [Parafilimonas sp.]|nr:LysM peptidoglycan-binding domain-containing protein [Parafilimonas sp.]